MKKLLLTACLTGLLTSVYCQEASIREEFIPFTTYSFSDPDPVARPGKSTRISGLMFFRPYRL